MGANDPRAERAWSCPNQPGIRHAYKPELCWAGVDADTGQPIGGTSPFDRHYVPRPKSQNFGPRPVRPVVGVDAAKNITPSPIVLMNSDGTMRPLGEGVTTMPPVSENTDYEVRWVLDGQIGRVFSQEDLFNLVGIHIRQHPEDGSKYLTRLTTIITDILREEE
jgi:hypothetical protein